MRSGPPVSVLHVAQSSEYGLGRYLEALVGAQRAKGWRVAVAGNPASALRPAAEAEGATWLAWEAERSPGPGLPAEVRGLGALVKRAGPDVVHLHSSKAGLAGRAALRGRLPTIFQPHAWSFYALGPPLRQAAVAWERLAARWAHVVVCGSEEELDVGRRAGIRAPWRLVPNAVDVASFPLADDEARGGARRRLGLSEGPLAICVGRLTRQKGQDLLLRAWPAVRASVPDASLVLVGDGEERARLEAGAPAGVAFAGRQDDVAPWMAAADVVVQPSRYETLSLSVLEALASGRSVVATDATGMREVIGADAGAVVPREDAAALAEAVTARLRDPERARREGMAGRERVASSHDLPDCTERLCRITSELAGIDEAPPTLR